MRTYSITIEHDNGTKAITTTASHILQAIIQVLEYEKAPNNAVVSAIELRSDEEE